MLKEHHEDGMSQLMTSIQSACKAIGAAVRSAGLTGLFGKAGNQNSSGEDQKKLDVFSNELFINLIKSSYTACVMVSEENETTIEVEMPYCGKYIVTFDPLDGSSNIDCLVSIGSIFGIFKKPDEATGPPFDSKIALQKGSNMIAAGYALYGSATMMVISVDKEVNGFMLDPAIGEFILTTPKMRIPQRGSIYAVNEGYESKWEPAVKEYVRQKKYCAKPYAARYTGSMVADIHRTILYGGIFLYPKTTDAPTGKLRTLYECFPMAHIVENAGGKATDGEKDILDIVPTGLHVRSPIFLGSADDVDDYLKCVENNK